MSATLYDQCVRVYEAMYDRATGEVYDGYTTHLFEELSIGIGNYTPVMRRLQAMHCVVQLSVGSRNAPSSWQLIEPPSERKFTTSRRARRSRIAALESRVEKLEELLENAS